MTYIAPKVTITVADIDLVGYKTESGEWVMSQSSMAESIGLDQRTGGRFLSSKWLKQFGGKGFEGGEKSITAQTNTGAQTLNCIPTDIVAKFWLYHSGKGNTKALALVVESMTQALDIRFEGNLTPEKSYQDVEELILSVQQERKLQLELKVQNLFQSWMVSHHFSPAKVHDYLTKCVVGRTAAESRELPQTCPGRKAVGLNHFPESEYKQMFLVSQVKLYCTLELSRPRKGWGYQDYINIAIQEVMS